jgi:hypothetical protein
MALVASLSGMVRGQSEGFRNVIKRAFLKKQVARSKHDRRTTPFLRRLIFSVVDREARRRYAANYCMRCFPCSAAIAMLLKQIGIQSGIVAGAFCIAEVFDDPRHLSWGGFWDRDHHVWVMTEFGEVIDLSVSQLHRHPRSARDDAIATPAIWWSDSGIMPPIFRYLPDSVVHAVADPVEAIDLDEFKIMVGLEFDRVLATSEVADIAFGSILDCMETLQAIKDAGDAWATKAFVIQRCGLPFPRWIVERETELMTCYHLNQPAPSRLAALGTLLQSGKA